MIARAQHRCEYCRLSEEDDVYTFHVEHIIPLRHGGTDATENLALSCQHCNMHKGPNLSGIDPNSAKVVPLFRPRNDDWRDNFSMVGFQFIGLTACGRATVQVLNMNGTDRLRLRQSLGFQID